MYVNRLPAVRRIAICAGIALTAIASSSSAEVVEDKTEPREFVKQRVQLNKVAEAARRQDCKTVLREGRRLIESSTVEQLQSAIYPAMVYCSARLDRKDEALDYAVRGTRLESSSDMLWHQRLWLQIELKRHEAAVATLEEMSEGRGAALNSMELRTIWTLHNSIRDAGDSALRKRLLSLLSGPAFRPDGSSENADGFRLEYVDLLLDDGDMKAAAAQLDQVQWMGGLMRAGVDPRQRPLLPTDLNWRQKAEAGLERHRERMALHPDRVEMVIEAAADLRLLGRPQEALVLLEKSKPGVESGEGFTDLDERGNWWWNALAYTYRSLGRYDDMVAAFRGGMGVDEDGTSNVSQVINLAFAQLEFGRPEDALRTLEVFDKEKRSVSPYGELQIRGVRGCSNAAIGQVAKAAEDVAFAVARAEDDPTMEVMLKVCTGDLDGAARSLIGQLDDPERREQILLNFAQYDDPPVTLPPNPFQAQEDALKQRPDVRAAFERNGGLPRFPLQRGEF